MPPDWLDAVRSASEASLLDLADHLPAEASEALLDLATGTTTRRDLQQTELAAALRVKPSREELREAEVSTMAEVAEEEPDTSYGDEGPGPFEHPDARRRFRRVANVEGLQRALDYPLGEVGCVAPPGPA